MPVPRSVAILGGGLAGLTAGLALARRGLRVTVLERDARPGGLLQCFRRDGARFDTGFHFLTDGGPGGAARRVLDRLGVAPELGFLAPDPDAQFVVHDADGSRLGLPAGLPAAGDHLRAAFPGEAASIAAFWRLLYGALDAKPWLSHLAADRERVATDGDPTVGEALGRAGLKGRARDLLLRLAGLLGEPAPGMSFAVYATIVGSALAGAWRLVDGGEGLIGALTRALRAAGGELRCGREVTAIAWSGRRVEGLRCADDDTATAELYLATCHPAETLRLAGPEAFRPGFRRALERRSDSFGGFELHATLDRTPEAMGRRHHLVSLDGTRDCYAIAPAAFAPADPPTLEALAWFDCRRLAPWHDSGPGARPAAYRDWKEARAGEILEALNRRFPGLADTIAGRWTCSPLSFRDRTRTRAGSGLGLGLGRDELAAYPLGPRNRLRNLFFTGQNATVPGMLGTMIGALELADRIAVPGRHDD